MAPNAGRILRRQPRRLLAPERDPVSGHYQRGRRHDDKQQADDRPLDAARQRRPSVRRAGVAIGAGVMVAVGVGALVVAAGDDAPGDGGTGAPGPTAAATTVVAVTAPVPTTTLAAVTSTRAPTTTVPTTTSPTTAATSTTVPGPESPAHAFAGRYTVTASVLSDSIAPERAGETLPFGPLVLTVTCDGPACSVSEPTFGSGVVDGDSVTFGFESAVPCIDATRGLVASVALTATEKDDLGFVTTLEGTATFDWSAAVSGGGPRCPAFVEVFSILAIRE